MPRLQQTQLQLHVWQQQSRNSSSKATMHSRQVESVLLLLLPSSQ
jgi:hypothetical protein